MTRRFPPALGIIAVIAAVYSLHQLSPIIAMVVREGFDLDWVVALFAGVSIAQLVAGIAIATGSTHARIAVLAWTLVSIASATFARDLMAQDLSGMGIAVMYIEAFAGPLIAWLALAFAGVAAPSPAIPRARVVSDDASDAASSSADVGDATRDLAARRRRVGVLLFGFAIAGLIGTLLWHLPMLALILRSDNVATGLISEGLFLGHAIAVALLAIRAGRRLLDPRVDARSARSAVILYLLVDVGGDLLRVSAQIIYQLVTDGLGGDVMTMLLAQWIAGAVFGLLIPAFIWFYVSPALRGPARPDADTSVAPPHDLAALPAWAMLWFAPFLLSRVLLVKIAGGLFAPQIVMVIIIICGTLGMLHLVAGVRALQSSTNEATRDAWTLAARAASAVSLVIAVLFVLGWCFLRMLPVDSLDRVGMQLPSMPLAQLVASSAMMVWALGRRRR